LLLPRAAFHRAAFKRVPKHGEVSGSPGCDPSLRHSLYQRGGTISGGTIRSPAGSHWHPARGQVYGGRRRDRCPGDPGTFTADLPEKSTQFSWVMNKDTFALQRFALVWMLRFGHRLLSKFGSGSRSRYPPLQPPPVRRINHCEYRYRQHNRSYALPEHHTRDVRNESGPGRNLMGEAKRR